MLSLSQRTLPSAHAHTFSIQLRSGLAPLLVQHKVLAICEHHPPEVCVSHPMPPGRSKPLDLLVGREQDALLCPPYGRGHTCPTLCHAY